MAREERPRDRLGRVQRFGGKWEWDKRLPVHAGGNRNRRHKFTVPPPMPKACCVICAGTHPWTCETWDAREAEGAA